MKMSMLWLFVILVGLPVSSIAQVDVQPSRTDELLFTIPQDQVHEALQAVSVPLRLYLRLPDLWLAGGPEWSFRQLQKAGVRVSVVDRQPWSESYAVVSAPEGRDASAAMAGLSALTLLRTSEVNLIKGSPGVFEILRARGVSCVEVERQEIPVSSTVARLPQGEYDRMLDTIQTIIARVSDSAVTSYIQGLQDFGTRYWANANRDSVSRWVHAKFQSFGYTDVVLDSFQYSGTIQQNVVTTLPGTVTPSAEIIVGGHHDSYSSNVLQAPGADDNASGTAAALEMARVLKLINYQPALTLRFIGFAAEEAGLRGSASYAQRARAANRDIRAMMNYDMIGYRTQTSPDRDVYVVWYTGSEAHANLHMAMMRTYTTLTPVLTTSYRSGSDSWSFFQQSYNSVFCIERDFSPYYHSPNDLIQYLDIPYAGEIIKSGLAMLLTLDAMPPSVTGLDVRDRGDDTSLLVQWDSVPVPDWYRYKVYWGTIPGVYTNSVLATSKKYLIAGLTTGTRYYVGVSIVDLANRESMIMEQSATPRVVPLAPAGMMTQTQPGGVIVRWRSNREVDLNGYNIYRASLAPQSFIRLNATPYRDTVWNDSPLAPGTYLYYTTAVDSSANESAPSDTVVGVAGPVGVGEGGGNIVERWLLHPNYPNPFNAMTILRYEIGASIRVSVKVFDVVGNEVATLVDEEKSKGGYTVAWDASKNASGVYFCRFSAGPTTQTTKMILIR